MIVGSAHDARFHDINFEVSETVKDLPQASHLCAQQVEPLPPGAVKYYPCTQGGILSIDRSRLFLAGRYIQLRMVQFSSNSESNIITVHEVEVHGY